MQKLKKGFTLIELIIVMAILGVLAAGLIAALDPIEQINRGNDSASESVAKQMADGTHSYFASNQRMPWITDTVNMTPDDQAAVLLSSAGGTSIVATLKANGDLKQSYTLPTRASSNVFISGKNSTGVVVVCSKIAAKSGKNNIDNLFDDPDGATQRATACPANNTCYRCFK